MSTPGTVLITGTTSGVGLNATRALVKRGWTVITVQPRFTKAQVAFMPTPEVVPVIRTVPGVDIKTGPGRLPVCRSALNTNAAGHESQRQITRRRLGAIH